MTRITNPQRATMTDNITNRWQSIPVQSIIIAFGSLAGFIFISIYVGYSVLDYYDLASAQGASIEIAYLWAWAYGIGTYLLMQKLLRRSDILREAWIETDTYMETVEYPLWGER